MKKSLKKIVTIFVALSAMLQLTAYANGISTSASQQAAAAANAQIQAAATTVPGANASAAAQQTTAAQNAAQQTTAQVQAAQSAAQQAANAAQASQQTITGVGGASIDMSSINQSALSPAEAMAIGQKLATVNGITITYQMPNNQTEVLDGLTIASWVTGNQGATVTLDATKVRAYVQSLKDKYDTKDGVQTWKSADGTTKSLKTSYGWRIDLDQEVAALTANIQSLQSVTREPIYSARAAQTEHQDDITAVALRLHRR